MKSQSKIFNGFTLLAIAVTILLVTSPAVAIPQSGPSLGTNTYSTSTSLEYGSVVAGIGQAAYASLYTFGGQDGSNIAVDISNAGFANAQTWVIASLHQDGFASYLQRSPSPVPGPDGLSLHLSYPAGSDYTDSLGWALSAAVEVESLYGVEFGMLSQNTVGTVDFVFWANNSDIASVESAVATDVEDLGTTGLSTLISASTVTSAPVFWSAYGARPLAGDMVVQFGAGWVDADGITNEGTNVDGDAIYKLSSANIFGGAVNPTDVNPALSRVVFTVPYPIDPTVGGISPATSNPLPHVTGIAQWDLKHPIANFPPYSLGGQSDLVLEYTLKTDEAFPNVQTKFSIDQQKLNTEGILEGTFDLTNVGEEDAKNIDVAFPVGPDFDKIANQNQTIHTIKDGVTLDTSYASTFNFTAESSLVNEVTVPVVGTFPAGYVLNELNEQFLNFAGWYKNASDGSVIGWDEGTTNIVLFSGQITTTFNGISVLADVNIEVTSPGGFPNIAIGLLNQLGDDITNAGVASFQDVKDVVKDRLPGLVEDALNQTLETFYDEFEIFYVYTQYFELQSFEFQTAADATSNYYFMTANVPELAKGASTSLSFRIENIPIAADTFQFVDYDYNTFETDSGVTMPNATIVSSEENWYQVMQYFFENIGYDGRPLSFGYETSVSFGLDAFNFDQYFSDQYVSSGSYVRFENANGYEFFSLSNGQNVQIADDEAVVSAALYLNKQVYYPGDDKTITVELENSGDLPAENVKVHLYHASLGRNWAFERRHKITTLDVGTLGAGLSKNVSHTTSANSFVGYSPVYAYVEFDSDLGQSAPAVPDYLNTGKTEFGAGAETHHIVLSTLTGALLLPQPGDVDLHPTIKEPRVEVDKTVGNLNADNEFDVTYTLSNTGKADTTIYFGQFYETTDFSLLSSSDDADAIKFANTQGGYGWVYYSGINLDVGESTTVTLTFKLKSDGGTLWPAFAYFSIAGESTLGSSVNTGSSTDVNAPANLMLSAGSQAQQESQQSSNTDSSSSSYSASSSVGASVNTDIKTKQNTVEGIGFLGYDAAGFLGLMLVPLGLTVFLRRRR